MNILYAICHSRTQIASRYRASMLAAVIRIFSNNRNLLFFRFSLSYKLLRGRTSMDIDTNRQQRDGLAHAISQCKKNCNSIVGCVHYIIIRKH